MSRLNGQPRVRIVGFHFLHWADATGRDLTNLRYRYNRDGKEVVESLEDIFLREDLKTAQLLWCELLFDERTLFSKKENEKCYQFVLKHSSPHDGKPREGSQQLMRE